MNILIRAFIRAIKKSIFSLFGYLILMGIMYTTIYYNPFAGIGLMLLLMFLISLYYSYIEEKENEENMREL